MFSVAIYMYWYSAYPCINFAYYFSPRLFLKGYFSLFLFSYSLQNILAWILHTHIYMYMGFLYVTSFLWTKDEMALKIWAVNWLSS